MSTTPIERRLKEACEAGAVEEVIRLSLSPEGTRAATAEENYALRWAAAHGHIKVVECLLGIEAVRDKVVAKDNEALRVAAEHGHIAIVKLLLGIEAVRDKVAAKDNYALRWAAGGGHTAIVKLLLEIGAVTANAAAMDNYALRWAAGHGHIDIVELLLSVEIIRINVLAEENYSLRWAAEHGHIKVVERLLSIEAVRANAAAMGNYALCRAAKHGHMAIVERLLSIEAVRANAAAMNNEALCSAAEYGCVVVVERLLSIEAVRVNAAAVDNKALCLAAKGGHIEVVERLLSIEAVRANAAAMNNKALCSAAEYGCVVIVERLLSIEAVRANTAARNNAALRLAARGGPVEIVERLLSIEAVRNATAVDNEALCLAVKGAHIEVVECLLSMEAVRANAAAMNNEALCLAVKGGHIEVVECLLNVEIVKTNAAAVDNKALCLAAKDGHIEIVKRLLSIEAVRTNAAAVDNEALCLAAKGGHIEIVKRLLGISTVRARVAARSNKVLEEVLEGVLEGERHLIETVGPDSAADDNHTLRNTNWPRRGAAARSNKVLEEVLEGKRRLIEAVGPASAPAGNHTLRNTIWSRHIEVAVLLLGQYRVRAIIDADNHKILRKAAQLHSNKKEISYLILEAYQREGKKPPGGLLIEGQSPEDFFAAFPLRYKKVIQPIKNSVSMVPDYSSDEETPIASSGMIDKRLEEAFARAEKRMAEKEMSVVEGRSISGDLINAYREESAPEDQFSNYSSSVLPSASPHSVTDPLFSPQGPIIFSNKELRSVEQKYTADAQQMSETSNQHILSEPVSTLTKREKKKIEWLQNRWANEKSDTDELRIVGFVLRKELDILVNPLEVSIVIDNVNLFKDSWKKRWEDKEELKKLLKVAAVCGSERIATFLLEKLHANCTTEGYSFILVYACASENKEWVKKLATEMVKNNKAMPRDIYCHASHELIRLLKDIFDIKPPFSYTFTP
jgi:ankyrin repeat protein